MSKIFDKNLLAVILLGCLLTAGFILASELSWYFLAALLVLILVVFFIIHPQIGIYLIAFLFPFNYWEFVYGNFNVPYVDIVALLLFAAWILKNIYLFLENKKLPDKKQFPGWFFMSVFVFFAALSLINVEREILTFSLKYLFRPIIFFYLMYVILPFNLIDSWQKLMTAFKVMFASGIGISLMGIWSLIIPPLEGVRRALPISIFGVYPLGTNHNLLAEVFVVIIPIALILFWQERDIFKKNIYLLGAFLMIGVNLLTLSRGGWLAMAVQLMILAAFRYRNEIKKIAASYLFYLVIVLFIPVIYLMYKLVVSAEMLSATLARLKLIDISFILFDKHPWIGNGIGTFTHILWQVQWYIIEYGGVTDAHGFIFKNLAEVGLLGSLAFGALLAYVLFVLIKAYNKAKQTKYSWLFLGLLMSVCGAIVFQLFGTGYFLAKLWLPVGVAFSAIKLSGLYFVKK